MSITGSTVAVAGAFRVVVQPHSAEPQAAEVTARNLRRFMGDIYAKAKAITNRIKIEKMKPTATCGREGAGTHSPQEGLWKKMASMRTRATQCAPTHRRTFNNESILHSKSEFAFTRRNRRKSSRVVSKNWIRSGTLIGCSPRMRLASRSVEWCSA